MDCSRHWRGPALVAEPLGGTKAATLTDGWRMVTFGHVARNVDVQERKPLEKRIERYVGLDHLEPGNLHIRSWGNVADGTTFTRRFKSGQVLFGKRRAYQRKAAFAEFDGICSGDILVFEPSGEDLLSELLPFIVESDGFCDYALRTSAGSLSPRTKWKELAEYAFPLPPKEEQRRIADVLWAADAAVERWREVLGHLKTDRVAYIDALIHSVRSDGTVSLGAVCDMQNGKIFPSSDYQAFGIRLLRPGNLGQDGYFNWSDSNTKWLPSSYASTAAGHLIQTGDLVMNLTVQSLEDGFMGRVCLAREGDEALLNQRIGRLLCKDWLLPEYLFRVMQTSAFRQIVETRCEGTKVRHLYWRHIEDFPLALADRDQQLAVIHAGRELDRATAGSSKTIDCLSGLAHELRENLLQRAAARV
jgi:type I restriction enzyme, S subunit